MTFIAFKISIFLIVTISLYGLIRTSTVRDWILCFNIIEGKHPAQEQNERENLFCCCCFHFELVLKFLDKGRAYSKTCQ